MAGRDSVAGEQSKSSIIPSRGHDYIDKSNQYREYKGHDLRVSMRVSFSSRRLNNSASLEALLLNPEIWIAICDHLIRHARLSVCLTTAEQNVSGPNPWLPTSSADRGSTLRSFLFQDHKRMVLPVSHEAPIDGISTLNPIPR